MVKRKRIISLLVIIAIFIIPLSVSAGQDITKERTTIVNQLPEVVLYADTDKKYTTSPEKIKVKINDYETQLKAIDLFKETGDGANYYFLIDTSKSLENLELELIKRTVISFEQKLSSKDKLYLIRFGDMVYPSDGSYIPGDSEFDQKINSLSLQDNNTKLYAALGEAMTIFDKSEDKLRRNITMVFSDGSDDTEGEISLDETIRKMTDRGMPLYAFAVGDDKAGKDALGILARSCNGSLVNIEEDNAYREMSSFHKVLENTLVIKTHVKNSEDIGDYFTARLYIDGQEIVVKEDVKANKDENAKDVFSVTLIKQVKLYWWAIAVALIAIIAIIALIVIKKNKGIVNVDGKIVYGSRIQRKYHVQVKEYNSINLTLQISIDGAPSIEQKATIVESMIVGRASICDLYFDDANMSRQHFSIEIKQGNLYINDLGSTSGTYLNGVKVYSNQKLGNGDVVNAGKTKIRVNW